MKKVIQISIIAIITVMMIPTGVSSQTTVTKATKEQEALIKAQEEQKKVQEEQKKVQLEIKKVNEEMDEINRNIRVVTRGDSRSGGTVDFFGPDGGEFLRVGPQQGGGYAFYGSNSITSTSLEFVKTVTENSATKEYTFDVDKDMKSVSLSISGSCKAGEISISVITPGNKTYSTVLIDEVGSMSWKKSFEVTEEDAKEKVGVWKFKVVTTKATGTFRLSLNGR